jgi:hypothetical protein
MTFTSPFLKIFILLTPQCTACQRKSILRAISINVATDEFLATLSGFTTKCVQPYFSNASVDLRWCSRTFRVHGMHRQRRCLQYRATGILTQDHASCPHTITRLPPAMKCPWACSQRFQVGWLGRAFGPEDGEHGRPNAGHSSATVLSEAALMTETSSCTPR